MTTGHYDIAIVGAGIIGLSTARFMTKDFPRLKIAVLEKEPGIAQHQTGHNSGVIHSGIYYKPGSQKAKFCAAGVETIKAYCNEKGIPINECGKVIVATNTKQFESLEQLYKRGVANGVPNLKVIGPEELREIEPHVSGIKAIHAPHTAIVSFERISEEYAKDIRAFGGNILLGHKVMDITRTENTLSIETSKGIIQAKYIINCGGLHADKIANMLGESSQIRIVPFRGEYYILGSTSKHLVRGLIYPVPDPRFPFLGVHYTKRITGEIEAGPNAVLAWAREGYSKTDVNFLETINNLTFPGFWRMAYKNWRAGVGELHRSYIKSVFVRDLQRLIPNITSADINPGGSGVRAQAINHTGTLLDDFSIVESNRAIHVLNAPSPGATSSLAIGKTIANIANKNFCLS
jgi:L-2-hydroxyglutarate oxidase LhgO